MIFEIFESFTNDLISISDTSDSQKCFVRLGINFSKFNTFSFHSGILVHVSEFFFSPSNPKFSTPAPGSHSRPRVWTRRLMFRVSRSARGRGAVNPKSRYLSVREKRDVIP